MCGNFLDGFKKDDGLKKWIQQKTEDFSMSRLLKKAKDAELKKNYKEAINFYLKFLEIKLRVIKERPEYGIKAYFELIPYYVTIAECYRNTKHLRPEDRIIDIEKSAEYYEKAAIMSIEKKDYKTAHIYYEEASKSYQNIEKYDKAALSYVKIAQMYYKNRSLLMASSAYVKAAELFEKGNIFEKAAKVYEIAAEINKKIKNLREAINNYENAGNAYQKLQDYSTEIKFYLHASEIASELEQYQKVSELYCKVGQAYENLQDYKNAIHYYTKALELGDDKIKKLCYYGIGRCYEALRSYPQSIENYQKAAQISLNLKENLETAMFYRDIARCYEILGDIENAANFYFQYAEFGVAEKDKESLKGYEKASEFYIKNAEEYIKKNEIEKAIKNYEKASDCYEKLSKYEKAAEIFEKIAELEFKIERYDKGIKAYFESANFHEKSGNFEKAGLAYQRAEDYKNAIRVYSKYAISAESESRFFKAGSAYKSIANCYDKLNDNTNSKAYYARAIHAYLKHLEHSKYAEFKKQDEENDGNTLRNIAESYLLMNETASAKKYFEKALDYYEKNKLLDEEKISRALLARVNAELFIRQGDYENAISLLREAGEIFNSLDKENFSKEYLSFIEKQKNESEKLLQDIITKPEVSLLMDKSSYTFINTPVVINAVIKNQSGKPVYDLKFLSHIPNELKVVVLPTPIDKLDVNEEVKNSIEILPLKVGDYRIRPLELYYRDSSGNKYVKASNNVNVKVVEKPSMDFKDYKFTINSYREYTETQLKNQNYYHAAEGYRGMAEVYGKFNEDAASKENYKRAIENYLKYSELLLKEKLDVVKLHAVAETYARVANCYEALYLLEESEKYHSMSIEYYEKAKELVITQKEKLSLEYQIMIEKALLSKVQAKFAIQHGDYTKVSSLLENSIHLFEEVIKKGDFDKEYEEFLDKNQREAKALMRDIQVSPDIALELEYPTEAKINTPHSIIVKVINKSNKEIFDLNFILRIPKEFELKQTIEKIPKLEPGRSSRFFLVITPKVLGEYKFKPLDLTYKDEKDNNYMKGCDQIYIRVSEHI
ncbi:MAG: tetratricopeptide repeat protein [Candidatus Altiarchaeota archaeon]